MEILVWSKYHCPYCDQAKKLLAGMGLPFTENKIGDGYTREDLLEKIPHARTLPQIVIDGQNIGGFNELKTYLNQHMRTEC
jgi:glutaredoxin 3